MALPDSIPFPDPDDLLDEDVEVKRPAASIDPNIAGFAPLLRKWLLRLLCDCGVVHDHKFNIHRFRAETEAVLPAPADACDNDSLRGFYLKQQRRYQQVSEQISGTLATNLMSFADRIGLNPVERELLTFLVLYQAFPPLEKLTDTAYPHSHVGRLPWQLSHILGQPHQEIERALSPDNILVEAGLIEINDNFKRFSLDTLIDIDHRLINLISREQFCVTDLLATAARKARATELDLTDFDFMASKRDLVVDFLKAVRSRRAGGVSILFDGPPGVGKSELSRVLVAELGLDGYEIIECDEYDNPASPVERLRHLRLAQRMIRRNANSLMILDEADAIFRRGGSEPFGDRRNLKAFLIRIIEDLALPTIWITNHGDNIDPAIRRRIDLAIRFPELPRQARRKLLERALPQPLHRQDWIEPLERAGQLTPARIAQAERVAGLIADDNAARHAQVFRQVLEENLDLDRKGQPNGQRQNKALPYRLNMVNADEDLAALTRAIRNQPEARLCLYGPPGTGKTRFAHHLAEAASLRLAEYRASDLLDMYVGNSEKHIRRMFDQCDDGRTLLLLDEADSLLRSRTHAHRNFEVNQVNELLKALENFSGVFVASTNLMDELDPAVMRRLDFKIRFGWLKPEQAWRLFLDLAAHLGLNVRGIAARRARRIVERIDCLTPGDFAMLSRRLRLRTEVANGEELARLLAREITHKPEAKTGASIGFTAPLEHASFRQGCDSMRRAPPDTVNSTPVCRN